LLRTLAQAEYSTHNIGHFALASTAYAHFTSPIRRYPDLINHRVMKAWLHKRNGPAGPDPVPRLPPLKESTEKSERCSTRERAIIQAERDAKALLSAAFMRDRIGDRFEGTVTGISRGGAFVSLDAPPVDGMIRRSLIEREFREPFTVDDVGATMKGDQSGRTLMIGDRVVVEITDVSLTRRQIDLALMGQLG
jgi:ribonuclease R